MGTSRLKRAVSPAATDEVRPPSRGFSPDSSTIAPVFQHLRGPLAVVFLSFAFPLLVWGFWPAGKDVRTLVIAAEGIHLFQASSSCLLQLNTPRFARAGDTLGIRLQFTSQGRWSTANAAPILARARLEMDNLEVQPSTAVSQPIPDAGTYTFYWRVTGRTAADYQGRLWIHLVVIAPNGETSDREQALAAMPLQVQTRTLLGLNGPVARGMGFGFALAGALLLLPSLSLGRERDVG
jgi:hypothetical protein